MSLLPVSGDDLALSSARREHDASNRILQSTKDQNVCPRNSLVRPVRPGGTPTTDASSPCGSVLSPVGEAERAGDDLQWFPLRSGSTAVERFLHHRHAVQSPPRPDPIGNRSIRFPGLVSRRPRSETPVLSVARTANLGALPNPLFLVDRKDRGGST